MKTEIYGTFGPACGKMEILSEMIAAGMTGMRLNLSHTTLSQSAEYIRKYQAAAKSLGVKPQILIDMKGPELRIGTLKETCILESKGLLCSEEAYAILADKGNDRIHVPVPKEVLEVLETGDEILLDDGKILLEAEKISLLTEKDFSADFRVGTSKKEPFRKKEACADELCADHKCVHVRVRRGGVLHSSKSIKIKNKMVSMPPLTPHDIENIKVAKQYGVTALMQPFVLSGDDLKYVRNTLKEYQADDIEIFAKIENRHGVEHLSEILPEADVIVIARGDLGNDMALWELPAVQKQMEDACKKQGVPYIVVTQMLASMEEHPVPTRAEVSDIYHAVYHGAWGVMLTGETAVGKYPVEAVTYMVNTAREAEC